MRLPRLTHLVVGSIYGRVRQIRPGDEIVDLTDVDLTDGDVVDVDLVQNLLSATPATPADPGGAPPR